MKQIIATENPIHVVSVTDRLNIPQKAWHNGNGWIVSGSFITDERFKERFVLATAADFSTDAEAEKRSAKRAHGLTRLMAMENITERWY